MSRPYEFAQFLILATNGRRRYPFALLSVRGIVAYFESRAAALDFITTH